MQPRATVAPEQPTTEAAPTTPEDGAGDPVEIGPVRLVEVARVPAPTDLTADPGTGTLYVAERAGRVHAVDPDGGAIGPPVLDLSEEVSTGSERGLLGLAFDPEGEHLYLSYSGPEGETALDEVVMEGSAPDPESRRRLFTLAQPFGNHNGGQIAFGPDGFLYLGLGDGGGAGDPLGAGQDLGTALGSILRIDPRDGDPYAIPGDNPFVDGPVPEIWLYGVRNPWRFSFDRETGDLWVADVGERTIEEITMLPARDGGGRGVNLGWSAMEGTVVSEGPEPEDHVPPVFEYLNDEERCSVTGGYVYRGSRIPGLVGAYVYGDFCRSEVRFLRVVDGVAVAEESLGVELGPRELASFGQGADGELYVLALGEGAVYRLEPA